ncbi:hypothetical protein [Streptomyces sp. NPDC088350]|uniref:hypothetical protein n=1 Tax=Streptomyces sp. NPDC088350 TaxID=3365854 RepID=UPI003813F884
MVAAQLDGVHLIEQPLGQLGQVVVHDDDLVGPRAQRTAAAHPGDVIEEVGVEPADEFLVVVPVPDVLAGGVDDEEGRQVRRPGHQGVAEECHPVHDVDRAAHPVPDLGEVPGAYLRQQRGVVEPGARISGQADGAGEFGEVLLELAERGPPVGQQVLTGADLLPHALQLVLARLDGAVQLGRPAVRLQLPFQQRGPGAGRRMGRGQPFDLRGQRADLLPGAGIRLDAGLLPDGLCLAVGLDLFGQLTLRRRQRVLRRVQGLRQDGGIERAQTQRAVPLGNRPHGEIGAAHRAGRARLGTVGALVGQLLYLLLPAPQRVLALGDRTPAPLEHPLRLQDTAAQRVGVCGGGPHPALELLQTLRRRALLLARERQLRLEAGGAAGQKRADGLRPPPQVGQGARQLVPAGRQHPHRSVGQPEQQLDHGPPVPGAATPSRPCGR